VEIGGFVEHLHDEGHTKLSFDEFILMMKTVQGMIAKMILNYPTTNPASNIRRSSIKPGILNLQV